MTVSERPRVQLWTFQRVYAEILAGETNAWLPLGNMMHQFFGAYRHLRAELVTAPLLVPMDVSPEHFRWAVFCAASVEYLCQKYDIAVPGWSRDTRYTLTEPWYLDQIGSDRLDIQAELREETPEVFARRNVFCGEEPYRNKYEHEGRSRVVLEKQQIA